MERVCRAVFVICLAAGSSAWADANSASVLPFELHRDTFIVAEGAIGRVGGLRLLFDTGTTRTVIDETIVRKLGLAGTRDELLLFGERVTSQRVIIPSIRLGPIEVAPLQVVTAPLSGLPARIGISVDAIVGLDVLRGRCFQIDYRSRQVVFARAAGWATSARIDGASPYLLVEATIESTPVRLMIDTGSEVIAIFARALGNRWRSRIDGEVVAAHLAGNIRLHRMRASAFRLGTREIPAPAILVTDIDADETLGYDGVLGVRALRARRVQIDFEQMVLSWTQ